VICESFCYLYRFDCTVIIIIIIINKDRIAATMYPIGTWFVSGICVWIPCIKETIMMMMLMIIIIIPGGSPS